MASCRKVPRTNFLWAFGSGWRTFETFFVIYLFRKGILSKVYLSKAFFWKDEGFSKVIFNVKSIIPSYWKVSSYDFVYENARYTYMIKNDDGNICAV